MLVVLPVLAVVGAIIGLTAFNAIWHPSPQAAAFSHAKDCTATAADSANCIQSTTALITEADIDPAGTSCSAVISFPDGKSERLPFSCDNQDLMTKGATLNVKLWRGQIVQYSRADMVTFQGPSLMLPLLIGEAILGVLLVSGGILSFVLLRRRPNRSASYL